MVSKSIEGDNDIGGCDFDETDPSKFIIKLFNSDERTLELRFIKIDNNECTCKISIVHPENIELHSKMTSLITSLNNYLVLIDDKRIMIINENKVLIQTEVCCSIRFGLNVPKTNDIIFAKLKKVQLLHFNEIKNELEVKTILKYYGSASISDIKIQNDHLIINNWYMFYIYKLNDIKINNISNQVVINKVVQEYCISLDKNILFSQHMEMNCLFIN